MIYIGKHFVLLIVVQLEEVYLVPDKLRTSGMWNN